MIFFYSKQKAQLTKFKNHANEKDSTLKEMQNKLDNEIKDKFKQREEIEDEVRFSQPPGRGEIFKRNSLMVA